MRAPKSIKILAVMEAASITGPAKNLLRFCRWLQTPEGKGSGLDVTIATFDRNSRAYASDGFAAAARSAGVETHIIKERYRFDPGVRGQIGQLIERVQPNIIQTHNNKSHFFVKSLSGARKGRIWFAFQHGHVYSDLKQRIYNEVDRLTLRSADRVVSVCQAFTERLITYGVRPDRIRVLHNSAAASVAPVPQARTSYRRELGIDEHDLIVLSVGRLSREKGHADLLSAMAKVASARKSWKVVIAGAGPELHSLEVLADRLGIRNRVVFAGYRQDAVQMLSIADVFVLPSHSEGSSNVLLEAMSAQIPIVATSAGGNPEIVVHEKTGLLVPVEDVEALAKAIEYMWTYPATASSFAKLGAERAAREFSDVQYRQKLADFYYEAVNDTPRLAKCTGKLS